MLLRNTTTAPKRSWPQAQQLADAAAEHNHSPQEAAVVQRGIDVDILEASRGSHANGAGLAAFLNRLGRAGCIVEPLGPEFCGRHTWKIAE
jgi:hypothetical protein